MKFRGLIAIPLLISSVAFSNISQDEYEGFYKRQQSTGQIYCKLANLRQKESKLVLGNSITTRYEIGRDEFQISAIKNTEGEVEIRLSNNQGVYIDGSFNKTKNIKLNFNGRSQETKDFVNRHGLKKMKCRVGVYYDKPIIIKDSKVHVSVHPHPEFDRKGNTETAINNYLSDPSIKSYIILDNYGYYQSQNIIEFINETAAHKERKPKRSIPNLNIPNGTEFYVHSTGWGFFQFEKDDVEIIYTGGNLNFCMFYSTNYVLDGFLQYNTSGNLTLTYDLNGIVAQKKGRVGPTLGGIFGKKKSGFYVKDHFNNNESDRKDFHEEHFEFLTKKKLGPKKSFYKTLTLRYKYKGNILEKTFRGTGQGHYNISARFINE